MGFGSTGFTVQQGAVGSIPSARSSSSPGVSSEDDREEPTKEEQEYSRKMRKAEATAHGHEYRAMPRMNYFREDDGK